MAAPEMAIAMAGPLAKNSAGKKGGESSRSRRGSVGNLFSKWERRHFELSGATLRYFAKEGDAEARGEVECAGGTCVTVHERDGAFDIETRERVLSLRADTDEQRARWVRALLAVGATYHPLSPVKLPPTALARSNTGNIKREAIIPWREIDLRDDAEPLGVGAMGAVYRARYARREVAVKVIKTRSLGASEGAEQSHLDKLIEECELMLKLRHPGVLYTFGLASDGASSSQGIVMELMEMPLGQLLADDGARSARQLHWRGLEAARSLLRIASEVAEAMVYLHANDVLHRDLKPGNILLGPLPQRQVKLMDFGECRQLAVTRRVSGLIRGTPSYIAPEVARRDAYGAPADVWSFGCLLVSMACRVPAGPHAAELRTSTPTKVIERIASGELHPMKALPAAADWPEAVQRLADACVAAEPSQRADFEEIARELTLTCGGPDGESDAARGEVDAEDAAEASASFQSKAAREIAAREAYEGFRAKMAAMSPNESAAAPPAEPTPQIS